MATLRKGSAVSNTQEISLGNSITLPPGTGFFCTRGGKAPKLAFVHPLTGEVVAITDRDGRLAPMMTPMAPEQLSTDLQAFFDLDTPPAPALRKGDIMALGAPVEVRDSGQLVSVPAGTRIKVMRGGASPRVMLHLPGHEEFRLMTLSAKDAAALVETSPVPDNASLSRITTRVRTHHARSEETTARSGTISVDDKRLEVQCDGQGDPLLVRSIDAGAGNRLANLLYEVLRDAEVNEAPSDTLIEKYLDFISGDTYGMETFAEYIRHRQAILKALTEKYG